MEIQDLSQRVDEETSVPPKLPTFRQGRVVRHEESNYESDFMATTTHIGTHMDAPYHFDADGRRIGDIDLEETIRPTKRADVRDVAEANAEITLDQVKDRLPAPVEPGEFLFVHTGWSDAHAGTQAFYGDNPYYAEEIAEYVVERDARGLITDAAIDPGDEGYRNHYTLLEADKVIVENVVNCEGLPDQFETYVIPMRLANGDGAPARVFVMLDE
jgi:kynurenine formamidase